MSFNKYQTYVIMFLGITYTQLKQELSQGMRLQKPDVCPEKIGQIMSSCFNETSDDRPGFSEIVEQLDHGFKQLHVTEKSTHEEKYYPNSIQHSHLQHSEDMKAQYVEMKSQNKLSRKQKSKESTIRKVDSLEESHNNVHSGIIRNKNQTYVNACFEPTEPETVQAGNGHDLKLNDQRLYTSMSHETPLLDVLSSFASPDSQLQRRTNLRRSTSQEILDKHMDTNVIKATQSCNPLYMVMDQLEPSTSSNLDDHKRNTICYV